MTENWLILRLLVLWKGFSKSEIKDFWRKLMPTFCRKPQMASFYSSLTLPYTKLCHRTTNRTTDRRTYLWNNLCTFSPVRLNKLRKFLALQEIHSTALLPCIRNFHVFLGNIFIYPRNTSKHVSLIAYNYWNRFFFQSFLCQ